MLVPKLTQFVIHSHINTSQNRWRHVIQYHTFVWYCHDCTSILLEIKYELFTLRKKGSKKVLKLSSQENPQRFPKEPKMVQKTSKMVPKMWFFREPLRGYCTPGPFWRLCAFSQKIKQHWTKYPMDLIRNVPRNSKITVLFQYRDHGCEVTVKNVWKSIFSMF